MVKCAGRFKEFRQHLFDETVPCVLEDRIRVHEKDMIDMWDFLEMDGAQHIPHDFSDPYFQGVNGAYDDYPRVSSASLGHLSLVPLFPDTYNISARVGREYLQACGNTNPTLLDRLPLMFERKGGILEDELDLEGRHVQVNGSGDLSGYIMEAGYGVGTIISGGDGDSEGIRSDSPFLIKVYKLDTSDRANRSLVSVIGFWAQDDMMLVSQMQSCKNGNFPEGMSFGEANLSIAETIARRLGFSSIACYSARNHPLLKEHPDNYDRLIGDLTCQWDTSAKKLGYNGGRSAQVHVKSLE